MRDYGKIETKFWAWAKRKKLSNDAKVMALYLLSGPHSTSVGIYYLPDGYIVADLEMGIETVTQTLSELFEVGFAKRCVETDFIFIEDYIFHNPPENKNVGKSMIKIILQIPDDFTFFNDLKEKLEPFTERFTDGFINGLGNGIATPKPKPKPKPKDDEKPDFYHKTNISLSFVPCSEALEDIKRKNLDKDDTLKAFINHYTANKHKVADWQAQFRSWVANARVNNQNPPMRKPKRKNWG